MSQLLRLLSARLSARFIVLTLLLLLVMQSLSFMVVENTVERYVTREVQESIKVAERVWENVLEQNHQRLEEGASVLAADFGFRAAVASRNQPTIASALKNSAQRIGASVAILLDNQWHIKASSLEESASQKDIESLVTGILETRDASASAHPITLYNDQATQFVVVPVRAPRVIGYVLMGFAIEERQMNAASDLSGVEIALLTRTDQSSVPRIEASLDNIEGFLRQHIRSEYFAPHFEFNMLVGEDTYVTHMHTKAVVGGHISMAFMKSLNAASARFEELFNLYLIITVLGSVVFAFAITWLSHRIVLPLRALTSATKALAQGNYDVTVTGAKRADEVGTLARNFDLMRSSVKSQSETISRLAYFDPLTSLPNRFNFRRFLLEAIQSGQHEHVSVLTVNLDRFKQVNDVLGYEMGDHILKTTALRMLNASGVSSQQVARISGDEFAIMVYLSVTEASNLAKQVIQLLQQPLDIEDTHIDLSASIGVATWPLHVNGCDSLMNASQLAMRNAKSRTQDVAVYHEDMVTSTPESLSLLSQLRRAVRDDELRVYLQPKIATHNQAVIAAEALIRWQHPEQGMIPPFKFIPFAEQTGFIRELSKWVIRQVVSQWHTLQRDEQLLRVSINLSVRDLMDPHFADFLQRTLAEYHVPASGLCLEITESAIMDDPAFAEQTLTQLASMGFRLSIDDFGTGYSSLGYLKRLPVHELKIDQSFVFGMIENTNDYVIVQSTVELAHNLGLDVVAEGVETEAMLTALDELGCEEAQGFFIGRPMPISDFLVWRTQWQRSRQYDN